MTARSISRWGLLGLLVVALLVLPGLLVDLWTELLWFQEVGYLGVFWTVLGSKAALFLVWGGLAFVVLGLNLRWAARGLVAIRRRIGNVEIQEEIPPALLRLGVVVTAGLLALLLAPLLSRAWNSWLLFLGGSPVGRGDPLFGIDLSFYLFRLPFLEAVYQAAMVLVVATAIAVAVVHVLSGSVRVTENSLQIRPEARLQLGCLLALFLLLKGADFLLDGYRLVYSGRGVVFGASYANVHAELPVLRVLAVASVVVAAVVVWGAARGRLRPLLWAPIGLLGLWLVGAKALPALIQRLEVEPTEIAKETPYIEMNIAATRDAFGLTAVREVPFPAREEITHQEVMSHPGTIDNIRLWDEDPLLQTFSQLQEIRLYYKFHDVDVDRYTMGGRFRQVMIALRELSAPNLPSQAQTWQNRHLTYTHGYGAVVNLVNEVAPGGLPRFVLSDIPPVRNVLLRAGELELEHPEIYFGELTGEYVIVRTEALEFDFPRGETNVYTSYEGEGGILLSSLPRRLAFAWRFGSLKLLLSEFLTEESRILFRRQIRDRVETIAPFLRYDRDPYPVLAAGRIFWILDAYTTSDRYPFSQPIEGLAGLNYLRNSVKVVLDAYGGTVTYYAFDPQDPVLQAYQSVFPDLFRPVEELPPSLRSHLRYPLDLFTVQAHVLATYHMTDPQVFYNREDYWNVTEEIYRGSPRTMTPYYQMLALPGEDETEFVLLLPFTPATKNNMIAALVARSDGAHYGELLLYMLPKDRLIYGPMQIEARIDQDAAISQELTLWSQRGSRVIRGNLLVIPVGESVLYVEPLFLQAEQGELPELKRVIAALGTRLFMAETLPEALSGLFGEGRMVAREGRRAEPPEAQGRVARPVQERLEEALRLYELARERLRGGDWAGYGEVQDRLGRLLEGLARSEEGRRLEGGGL